MQGKINPWTVGLFLGALVGALFFWLKKGGKSV